MPTPPTDPTTSSQAPTATPGVQQAPLVRYGVGLQQAIEAIRTTIEIASKQGVSQARITLQPEELGDIRIHLSQTAEGLVARVMADTPAAAQALADGHAELRQSLSSLGLSLLRLDIGSFDQPGAQSGDRRSPGRSGDANTAGTSTGASDIENPEAISGSDTTHHPLELTSGALVDVLA